MCVQIEIHILHRKQGDRHIVTLLHLFFEYQVVAQTLYAAVSLCGRLLRDQEIYSTLFQTRDVPA